MKLLIIFKARGQK